MSSLKSFLVPVLAVCGCTLSTTTVSGCSLLNAGDKLTLDQAFEAVSNALMKGDGKAFCDVIVPDELSKYGCTKSQVEKFISGSPVGKLNGFKRESQTETLTSEPGRLVRILHVRHSDGRHIGIPFWVYQTEKGAKVSCALTSAVIGVFGTFKDAKKQEANDELLKAWAEGARSMRAEMEAYGIRQVLMPETQGKVLNWTQWIDKQEKSIRAKPPL